MALPCPTWHLLCAVRAATAVCGACRHGCVRCVPPRRPWRNLRWRWRDARAHRAPLLLLEGGSAPAAACTAPLLLLHARPPSCCCVGACRRTPGPTPPERRSFQVLLLPFPPGCGMHGPQAGRAGPARPVSRDEACGIGPGRHGVRDVGPAEPRRPQPAERERE
jgi:hypothetical protein